MSTNEQEIVNEQLKEPELSVAEQLEQQAIENFGVMPGEVSAALNVLEHYRSLREIGIDNHGNAAIDEEDEWLVKQARATLHAYMKRWPQ